MIVLVLFNRATSNAVNHVIGFALIDWSEPMHSAPHQAPADLRRRYSGAAVQKATLKRRPTIPCSGEKNPCSTKENSLFSEEQGMRRKPLNPFGDGTQTRLRRSELGEVSKDSLLISLF